MLSKGAVKLARIPLSQAQIGKRIGESQQQVARFQRGASVPSIATLLVIQREFGIDPADFAAGSRAKVPRRRPTRGGLASRSA